jgi:hypothetical protein
MTATNHALAGAVIALVVKQPWLALPLALASHFALDSLPHFGNHPKFALTSRSFLFLLAADAGAALAILLSLGLLLPGYWLVPVAGAILAMSPDLLWFPNYVRGVTGRRQKKVDPFTRWHSSIQHYELPWGWYVELAWFLGFMPLLFWLMFRL